MINNQHDNKISVLEMMMLCWMYSKIRHDKIGNDNVIERIGVEKRHVSFVTRKIDEKLNI